MIMSRVRLSILFLLFLILPRIGHAQVFGTVRVNLLDAQDLALPGTTVVLKAEASTWTQMTTADSQGDAVFAAVPIGHYMVTASLESFKDEQQDIEVTSNAIVPVRMKLKLAGLSRVH